MTALYAVIGGSGFYSLDDEFKVQRCNRHETPYGETSAELLQGHWNQHPLVFLPRHGNSHQIPPHCINYRANLWALQSIGVTHIIAANAVGGIRPDLPPGTLVLPDQIVDYSSGRDHSFYDASQPNVEHIDFTLPYSETMCEAIIEASKTTKVKLVTGGTYGCTNGPRLETAAEIRKMAQDGCHMIGMTGMPEAALARELSIEYASIALVVNWCAGIEGSVLDMEQIKLVLEQGMDSVQSLIQATLDQVAR